MDWVKQPWFWLMVFAVIYSTFPITCDGAEKPWTSISGVGLEFG